MAYPEKVSIPLFPTACFRAPPYVLMIIDFSHSCKDYDEILNHYGQWEYICSGCDSKHSLHRHGKYGKTIVLLEENVLSEKRMEILRLKCSSCGKTHAILTSDMIPFFSYSLPAFLNLVCMCSKTTGGSVLKTEKSTGVSYQLLYRFIGIFLDYARRIILLIRKNTYSEDVPEQMLHEQLPELLAKRPPPQLWEDFFHENGIPVFLRRFNAASMPLSFCTSMP